MAGRSTDNAPASGFVAISKSNDTIFPATRGIYVGVAGDIYIDGPSAGVNVKMKAVPVGTHAWQVTRVYDTGTTATDMVALY